MAIQRLSGTQLATRYCLRPLELGWLLGSGASASAGIPTGYAMITDFKKTLFCELSATSRQEVDVNDPVWVARINQFFVDRAVLPAAGDPGEYARAFEAAYPTPEQRRAYIDDAIRLGTPSFAHRVLASLITTRRVPCVFTTNFDPLVEQATTLTDQLLPAGERVHLTDAAIDNPDRAALALREQRPFLAKLHGDYQSVALMNTAGELREQDATMRAVLTNACSRFGLVVVGYSGRDASVMEALTSACAQPGAFPGGIYWVASRPDDLLPAVRSFLEAADNAGITCAIVHSPNFDELAGDIADGIELPPVLREHVSQGRPAQVLTNVPLPTHETRKLPILQCSAIPIFAMPTVARRITVARSATTVQLRELLKAAGVWAICAANGREIAAFGPDAGLMAAFASLGPTLADTVALSPQTDSWATGLIYDALVRAVCRDRPLFPRLRRSGHIILVAHRPRDETEEAAKIWKAQLAPLQLAYSGSLTGKVPQLDLPFNEGAQLRIEQVAERWWCAFEPITYVKVPRDEPHGVALEVADGEEQPFVYRANPATDWRRERWAGRYNNKWASIIGAWARMLAGEDGTVRALGLAEGEGQDAVFQLSSITAWSRPGNHHNYFDR